MSKLMTAVPAWVLACLPVRWARPLAAVCGTDAPSTAALETAAPCTRQLLVDVSVIHRQDARTGIQRVVRSLLLQLLQSPPLGYEVRPIFATKKMAYHYAYTDFLTHSNAEMLAQPTAQRISVQAGDVFLGLDLAAHVLPRHGAQILGWKRAGVKVHVLVYDFLPLLHPEWFNARTVRHFKSWTKWLATYADSAVCISETVRADLADCLHKRFSLPFTALPSSRISLGADIDTSVPSRGIPAEATFTLARMRNTPSLLMVGTLEPRKGHDQVLAAFDELQRGHASASTATPPLLVIVGRPGWKTEALQQRIRTHAQAGKQVIWFEEASDELLVALYSACTAVVVASRGEGFGLPLIEAALYGKPIIARDLPAFREHNIPDVDYFHGDSPAALVHAIESRLRKKRLSKQAPIVAPTWEASAAELKNSLSLPASPVQRLAA